MNAWIIYLHVGHVDDQVQKNIMLSIQDQQGEQHSLVIPERMVASQELGS